MVFMWLVNNPVEGKIPSCTDTSAQHGSFRSQSIDCLTVSTVGFKPAWYMPFPYATKASVIVSASMFSLSISVSSVVLMLEEIQESNAASSTSRLSLVCWGQLDQLAEPFQIYVLRGLLLQLHVVRVAWHGHGKLDC